MKYPRLPRNIYSYRATVFGVPLRDALILSAVASASLMAIRISIYSPLISLSLIPWIILRNRGKNPMAGRGPKLKIRGKRFGIIVSSRIILHNGHAFLLTDGYACVFYEIRGLNVLAMRTGSQSTVMERLRTAIEDSGISMDFFTVHNKKEDEEYRAMEHSTFVRFNRQASQPEREVALDEVSSTGMKFQNSLMSAGIDSRELKEQDEIEGLLNSLVA